MESLMSRTLPNRLASAAILAALTTACAGGDAIAFPELDVDPSASTVASEAGAVLIGSCQTKRARLRRAGWRETGDYNESTPTLTIQCPPGMRLVVNDE